MKFLFKLVLVKKKLLKCFKRSWNQLNLNKFYRLIILRDTNPYAEKKTYLREFLE